MEETSNPPQPIKPKSSHSNLWDVISVLASVGIIFFMIFLVMQVNSLEQIVDEQNRLTQGIKDNIKTIPNKEVLTEVHYIENEPFTNYLARRKENVSAVRFDGAPSGFEIIHTIDLDNCPSDEGACRAKLRIYGRSNWKGIEGDQPFYIEEKTDLRAVMYGPYMDDLQKLMGEAMHIKVYTDSVQ